MFTSKLTSNLADATKELPASEMPKDFGPDALTPDAVKELPAALHDLVVNAYTDALAPAFWYLVPLGVLGFVIAFFMKELKLSDQAGLVARGAAVAK
ncbi:hypothetical protein D3C74_447650 [compost metagenome]